MDVASVMSPIGLWTSVLKSQGFLEPEVTIFERQGGTELALS